MHRGEFAELGGRHTDIPCRVAFGLEHHRIESRVGKVRRGLVGDERGLLKVRIVSRLDLEALRESKSVLVGVPQGVHPDRGQWLRSPQINLHPLDVV